MSRASCTLIRGHESDVVRFLSSFCCCNNAIKYTNVIYYHKVCKVTQTCRELHL